MSIENPMIFGTQEEYCWDAFVRGYCGLAKTTDDPLYKAAYLPWWEKLKADPTPIADEHALFKMAWFAGVILAAEPAFNSWYFDILRTQPVTK